MGAGLSIPKDKHCVVIGAGYAGTTVALGLMKGQGNFTIIDARDSFHHCIAAVRAIVDTELVPKTFIPLKETFGDHFKKGHVSGIDPQNKTVRLESGEEIQYDVLVIATGSTCQFPAKTTLLGNQEMIKQYKDYVEKVQSSKSIVVVGGGPVGVEIATEIASKFTGDEAKTVTVVHSRDRLVGDEFSQNFYKKVNDVLTKLKVKVITGEKVTNLAQIPDEGPFTLMTDKGTEIEADLYISCVGSQVNSDAYKDNLTTSTQENGMLKVDEFLRVDGYEDIFAIGDCANVPELKIAYLGQQQGEAVVQNISLYLNGSPLKKYQAGKAPAKMVLSLGPNNGAGETKGGSLLPEFMIKMFKCRDLMIGKTWSTMKQSQPR